MLGRFLLCDASLMMRAALAFILGVALAGAVAFAILGTRPGTPIQTEIDRYQFMSGNLTSQNVMLRMDTTTGRTWEYTGSSWYEGRVDPLAPEMAFSKKLGRYRLIQGEIMDSETKKGVILRVDTVTGLTSDYRGAGTWKEIRDDDLFMSDH